MLSTPIKPNKIKRITWFPVDPTNPFNSPKQPYISRELEGKDWIHISRVNFGMPIEVQHNLPAPNGIGKSILGSANFPAFQKLISLRKAGKLFFEVVFWEDVLHERFDTQGEDHLAA